MCISVFRACRDVRCVETPGLTCVRRAITHRNGRFPQVHCGERPTPPGGAPSGDRAWGRTPRAIERRSLDSAIRSLARSRRPHGALVSVCTCVDSELSDRAWVLRHSPANGSPPCPCPPVQLLGPSRRVQLAAPHEVGGHRGGARPARN